MTIYFNQLSDKNIYNALERFKTEKGHLLKEMKLWDFIYDKDTSGYLGNGVYLVKDENENIVYIGKTSSRPFLERWGGHLDLREEGSFNNLLKTIRKINNYNSLHEAANKLFNYKIVMIVFQKDEFNFIPIFEKLFLNVIQPKYNKRIPKFKSKVDHDNKLVNTLEHSTS